MSLRYLFPCQQCQHKFEVVSKQAGQELVCPDCDTVSEAPKLGILKQLEVVDSDTVAEDAKSGGRSGNAGSWKNILFVSGLALAIIAGAAGFALYRFAQSKVIEFDVAGRLEEYESWLDEQPPNNVLRTYVQMDVENTGLPEWVEQPHIGSNKQAAILKNFAYGLFGLASVGVLTLLSSFLVRS